MREASRVAELMHRRRLKGSKGTAVWPQAALRGGVTVGHGIIEANIRLSELTGTGIEPRVCDGWCAKAGGPPYLALAIP